MAKLLTAAGSFHPAARASAHRWENLLHELAEVYAYGDEGSRARSFQPAKTLQPEGDEP
jgi:hypothetical protein